MNSTPLMGLVDTWGKRADIWTCCWKVRAKTQPPAGKFWHQRRGEEEVGSRLPPSPTTLLCLIGAKYKNCTIFRHGHLDMGLPESLKHRERTMEDMILSNLQLRPS